MHRDLPVTHMATATGKLELAHATLLRRVVDLEEGQIATKTPDAPAGVRNDRAPTHEVFDDFARLEPMHDEWDAFVERVGGDLFASYDWCDVWWRHYGKGRRLYVHVLRDGPGGSIIAVLPLFAERIRVGPFTLRVIRLVACDHSVTSVAPAIDPKHIDVVLRSVVEHLARAEAWDVMQLGPLPAYYDHVEAAASSLRQCGAVGDVTVSPCEPHMCFEVPPSYDAFLEGLSTKERRNVRRDERKLDERGEVTRELVQVRDHLREAFETFIDMHQAHWRKLGHLGHFADWPGAVAFHRDMVERQFDRGRLMLSRVCVGDDTVASEYSYAFGRRAHWILAGRREGVPGRIGFCGLVRHACDRGLTLIDAMRGSYEYKRLLGATSAPQQSILALRAGSTSPLRYRMLRTAARALDLAYYRVYFSRLAPKLPWTPGPLWRSWIRSRL